MTFSSEQIRRARELARERRKHGAIQRLLIDEFNLRPAQCRALLMTAAQEMQQKNLRAVVKRNCQLCPRWDQRRSGRSGR